MQNAQLPFTPTAPKGWNATNPDYLAVRSLSELIETQVARTPQAIAVVSGKQRLTYHQLNSQVNQLAHWLRRQGVRPEVCVGLCLPRSLEMLVSVLAILKAGGAYVPLDPAYPIERLTYILHETKAPIILTIQSLLGTLPEKSTKRCVCLDKPDAPWSLECSHNLPTWDRPENLAYILYTSGSTGQPKGVMIERKSLVNYLYWASTFYSQQQINCLPTVTPLSFDGSLKQLLAPLLNGKYVWLLPEETTEHPKALLAAFQTASSFALSCVPSLWKMLLKSEASTLHNLRGVLTDLFLGGEVPGQRLLAETWAALPDLKIWNFYGPTEGTVNACVGRITSPEEVHIGQPITNVQVYLLDSNFHLISPGETGELYIGGAGVGRGYLNHADLTAERFIPDPFGTQPGGCLYRSGDLGRYRADGSIEFLGRLDHQVKVRGLRIELGEIETVLAQHPAIHEAVVDVQRSETGDTRLIAYLLPTHSSNIPDRQALHEYLRQRLPSYMLPSAFVPLKQFPLTPSGKLNRRALPAPESLQQPQQESRIAPCTPTEELLMEIWTHALHREQIGIHDNFFELGGDSLLAMLLISRMYEAFGIKIPLRCFFDAPVIGSLGEIIDQKRGPAPIANLL